MSDEPHKERIWPVFVLAAGVVVLGTWLAFASQPTTVEASAVEEPFISPLPAFEPAAHDTVELGPFTSARRLAVDLRQERQRGDDLVRTRVSFDLVETAPVVRDGRRVWERSYENVDIATTSNGEPLGADVADEVERLLETARVEVTGHMTGEVESTRVVSAEAAQLRHVLSVIRQTLDVALPRIPREAVRTDETWTWSIPVEVVGSEGVGVEAGGNMNVTAAVLGQVESSYLIDLQLEGELRVAINVGEGSSAVSNADGSGQGQVLWQPERGLTRSELRWEQSDAGTLTRVRATIVDESK